MRISIPYHQKIHSIYCEFIIVVFAKTNNTQKRAEMSAKRHPRTKGQTTEDSGGMESALLELFRHGIDKLAGFGVEGKSDEMDRQS